MPNSFSLHLFKYIYFLFLKMRNIKKITNTITKTDTNIPTPIPVLKIPPTTAQPENVVSSVINNAYISICFFII